MTAILFKFAFNLGLSTWFLAIFEMITLHYFWEFAFRVGIPVKRISLDLDTNKLQEKNKQIIKKEEGKFYFTDKNVLFLSQLFFLNFRTVTPFPIKAIATIKSNNKIDIVARIPIGSTLFFSFWFIGWTVGTVILTMQSGNLSTIGFGLLGWLFAGLMIGISYPIEKNRLEVMISELKEIILEHNNNSIENNNTLDSI